jgi:Fur family transcriptional regulator, ferric uptake regulator
MTELNREHLEQARQRLRLVGARLTLPRTRVLAELLAAQSALSHADVLQSIEGAALGEAFDRVTVYRVLDWLVDQGLAHRLVGADRAYRFSAHLSQDAALDHQHTEHVSHGHFRCKQCERMFCLPNTSGLQASLQASVPSGFAGEAVEVTVLGRCSNCNLAASPLA